MPVSEPILWPIILQIVLIGINAVFSCAEIAIITMNDNKLSRLAASGDKRAMHLAELTGQPARFFRHDSGGHHAGRVYGQRLCRR